MSWPSHSPGGPKQGEVQQGVLPGPAGLHACSWHVWALISLPACCHLGLSHHLSFLALPGVTSHAFAVKNKFSCPAQGSCSLQYHVCTQSQATYSPQSQRPKVSSPCPPLGHQPSAPRTQHLLHYLHRPRSQTSPSPSSGCSTALQKAPTLLPPILPAGCHRCPQATDRHNPQSCSGVEGFSASPPRVTHLRIKAGSVGSTCSASGTKTASSAPGAAAPPPAEPNPARFSNVPEHSYWGGRGQSPAHQQRLSPRARPRTSCCLSSAWQEAQVQVIKEHPHLLSGTQRITTGQPLTRAWGGPRAFLAGICPLGEEQGAWRTAPRASQGFASNC